MISVKDYRSAFGFCTQSIQCRSPAILPRVFRVMDTHVTELSQEESGRMAMDF